MDPNTQSLWKEPDWGVCPKNIIPYQISVGNHAQHHVWNQIPLQTKSQITSVGILVSAMRSTVKQPRTKVSLKISFHTYFVNSTCFKKIIHAWGKLPKTYNLQNLLLPRWNLLQSTKKNPNADVIFRLGCHVKVQEIFRPNLYIPWHYVGMMSTKSKWTNQPNLCNGSRTNVSCQN